MALLIGGAIGYKLDLVSIVEGDSMLPTLQPGERLLQIPAYLILPFAKSGASLAEKIVVLEVDDGRRVCKRVKSISKDHAGLEMLEGAHFYSWNGGDLVAAIEADIRRDQEKEKERRTPDIDASSEVSVQGTEPTAAQTVAEPQPAAAEVALPETGSNNEVAVSDQTTVLQQESEAQSNGDATASVVQGDRQAENIDFPQEPPLPLPGFGVLGGAGIFEMKKRIRSTIWDRCRDDVPTDKGFWVWVEGDNSWRSFDSRNVGALHSSCLTSMPVAVVWPPSKIRLI